MDRCIWIGIGAIIEKESSLYPDLTEINDFLAKKMSGGFGYSDALRPHVNFYDLSVDSENMGKIESSLKEVLSDQKPIECKILGIKSFKFGVIYAEVEINKKLVELHQKIFKTVSQFRGNCIDPDYEKLTPVLSEEQKRCLNEFGNPYMTDFKPHITLGYLPDRKYFMDTIISQLESVLSVREFAINRVDLVKGKTSDQIEIVFEYKFL